LNSRFRREATKHVFRSFPNCLLVKIGTLLSRNHNNFQDQKKIKLPRQYIWNDTSAAKFTAAFHSNDILSWLQFFENTTFDLSSIGAENATSHLQILWMTQQNVDSN